MNDSAALLAIESAVAGGSLSLWRDGREVGSWVGHEEIARAENLLPNIDHLLAKYECRPGEVRTVAVSAGPGSFTGIRVGIATAIGLARGLNSNVRCVSLLDAMLAKYDRKSSSFLAAIPMGRGSICFKRSDQNHEPETAPVEDFIGSVGKSSSKSSVLHSQLYDLTNRSECVIDAGENMAAYIAEYCITHSSAASAPLFVSKSF